MHNAFDGVVSITTCSCCEKNSMWTDVVTGMCATCFSESDLYVSELDECALILSPSGKIFYHYLVGGDGAACTFSLLSEVGEAWVPVFQRMLEEAGVTVEKMDTGLDYYDSWRSK